MEQEKIEAVSKRLPPKIVKQLQSFLGLCNYYRKFIKDYADIAAQMFKLLKKSKFSWTEVEQESFVEDNFHVCNTPNVMDLNNIFLTVPSQCTMSFKNSTPILHKNPEKKNAKLFIQTPYTLYGKSIQCQKLHVKITSYKNFFGAIWSNKEINTVELSKNDCINMEKDLLCESHVMSCEEKICHYDGTPLPIYKYLQKIVIEGYICRKWYRNLESKDQSILEKCKINDLECQLKDSIVIWEINILNNCLFRVLEIITITRPYNDIIYNEEKDQALKLVSKEFNCKNEIFKTT
ncbi:unnamed protein product, partial [Brachionus calyciflorus]